MAEFLNHGNRSVRISEIAEIETIADGDHTVVKLWGRRPEPLVVSAEGEFSVSDVLMLLSQANYSDALDVYWVDLLD